jgi:hypothetical protein
VDSNVICDVLKRCPQASNSEAGNRESLRKQTRRLPGPCQDGHRRPGPPDRPRRSPAPPARRPFGGIISVRQGTCSFTRLGQDRLGYCPAGAPATSRPGPGPRRPGPAARGGCGLPRPPSRPERYDQRPESRICREPFSASEFMLLSSQCVMGLPARVSERAGLDLSLLTMRCNATGTVF